MLVTGPGWRRAFYINLPVGVVAWLVGRRVLPRTAGRLEVRTDYPGVLLVSSALRGAGAGYLRRSELGLVESSDRQLLSPAR